MNTSTLHFTFNSISIDQTQRIKRKESIKLSKISTRLYLKIFADGMNVFFWLWSITRKLSFLICHSKMLENYRKEAKLKQINVKNNGTNTAGKEENKITINCSCQQWTTPSIYFLGMVDHVIFHISSNHFRMINLHFQNIFATWNLMPFYHNPANKSTTDVSLQTFLRYGTQSFERLFSSVDFPAHAL